MRAFLTVLGVIIGTGTIIGVGSILTGFDGAVTGVLRSFGTNTLIVFKFKVGPRTADLTPEERMRKPLTFENAQAIEERCPSVERVSAYMFPPQNNGPRLDKARYKGNDSMNVNLGGTDSSYALGGQAEMDHGRFFTDTENTHHMPVVVIGADIVQGTVFE